MNKVLSECPMAEFPGYMGCILSISRKDGTRGSMYFGWLRDKVISWDIRCSRSGLQVVVNH